MREVVTGVWHWKAAHPEWMQGQTWDRMVSSYAIDTGEAVLLFDPVEVPGSSWSARAQSRLRARSTAATRPGSGYRSGSRRPTRPT